MTDLLTKPEDTGDIPAVDPGPTRNLSESARRLPPTNVLRLYVTGELPAIDGYATVDGELHPGLPPGQPRPSGPLPAPPPPAPAPSRVIGPLSAGDEVAWEESWRPETEPRGWWDRLRYRGEHRAAGR